MLSLSGRRSLSVVRQSEAAECGLASLATIAAFYGNIIDLPTMRRRFDVSAKGTTLKALVDIASAIDLNSRAIRCEINELNSLRLPAILHWRGNHFVVLGKVRGDHYTILDPAAGHITYSKCKVSKLFTGVAMEISPSPTFQRARPSSKLGLSSIIHIGRELSKAFIQTIVLSIIVEALMLASPFYFQLVIDEAVTKQDIGLLSSLALIFCFVMIIRVVAQLFRSLSSQFISSVLSFDIKARIFNHLIRLPLDWYHKRHVGDIQSRFGAVKAIQAFVGQGVITGALDGILGCTVLFIMFWYSIALTAIVVMSVLIYAIVKAGSIQFSRRYASDAIFTDAREQTKLLESLRAIETIKSAAGEEQREALYKDAAASSVNAQIKSGNVQILYSCVEELLLGITDIIIVFFGARLVLQNQLSLGMLGAFMAYKSQFSSRSANLIDQIFSWRLLDLQMERLSDIVLTNKESRVDDIGTEKLVLGKIECKNVAFRYSITEKYILAGINVVISPGECVAIVGPSGCGKSTLGKILVGLYEPSYGELLIDDKPINLLGKKSLRRQISYVSQDDQLLSGSLAENIASFGDSADMAKIIKCAKIALIHDDIMDMPMGYESLVGDMGSSISGGQKQRVFIARALYRDPKILILDEATSQLDIEHEKGLAAELRKISMTRVIIAHRPETIQGADRIIEVRRTR